MKILTLRTDKPESEIGLYDSTTQIAYQTWEAHRALAETIHKQIKKLLESQNTDLQAIEAIIIYKGPGSFTGLRIGISVANALAYSLQVPIVATNGGWIEDGIARLQAGENDSQALPDYGAPANITTPKK